MELPIILEGALPALSGRLIVRCVAPLIGLPDKINFIRILMVEVFNLKDLYLL